MALTKNKTMSLNRLFLKYLIGLSCTLIIFLSTVILLVSMAFQFGVLLPANYTDNTLTQLESTLKDHFDKNNLPAYCHYIIISPQGQVLESTMSERTIAKAKTYLLTGNKGYATFYKRILQDNGNIILLQYDMFAHFKDPKLHYWIPYPELALILFVLGCILALAVITSLKFSRALNSQLNSITRATKKIQNKDLDFDITPTRIEEFNSILYTIEQLKDSLATSLKEQWNKEQQKKKQLSALTHDIKTPLTVIRGNADLLAENNVSEDDQELIRFIQSGTANIEAYLESLMHVANDQSIQLNKQVILLEDFLHYLSIEALSLCNTKDITFQVDHSIPCDIIYADYKLLKRALMNIIDNAVRYSATGSSIHCILSEKKTSVSFHIIDYGKGFSKTSIKKATEEFYTEDTARSNHHYGLGLSFAAFVATIHNGTLDIKTQEDAIGSVVSITIAKNEKRV